MATSSRLVASPPFAAISRDESSSIPSMRTSSFHGARLRIFNRSTDLHKKLLRSFAVADMVIDGATSPQVPSEDKKVVKEVPAPAASLSEASKLISDISNLVKLVDSKDIVELELKHKEYEIVIRKAEALAPPPTPAYAPPTPGLSYRPYPDPTPSADPVPVPSPPQEDLIKKEPEPVYPSMVSPMAGTFYRAPGPGEPAFVKEGDRVKKGQVICIIEAMKLMNEIECDQDGTVVKILAEDGKPISADAPLFMIQP